MSIESDASGISETTAGKTPFKPYFYVLVLFLSILLSQTIRYFIGSEPIVGAQPAQIVLPWLGLFVALPFWFTSPAICRAPPRLLSLFFGLLSFMWLWSLVNDWGAVDFTAYVWGPMLLMLALKPPPPAEALRTLNSLAFGAIALFIGAAIFAWMAELPPTGFITKWPPLTDPFEPIGMWWAPFNGPAESGAIGAILVLLGLAQIRKRQFVLVAGGLLILFYAGTLSAALGLAVGVVVLLLSHARQSPRRRMVLGVTAFLGALGMVVLVRELIDNPSLSARTRIWSDFIDLIRANPVWGWGSETLIESEQLRTFPFGGERLAHGSDAHNLLLDAWVRHGLAFLLAALLVLVVSVVVGVKAWKSGSPVSLALIALIICMGLTESNVWWGNPGLVLSVLILAVLTGAGAGVGRREDAMQVPPDSERREVGS